ncbi:MAG: hypothetical protein ACI920_000611 [Saprospiraceae bacterium]|jgi:hypothetical protein
MRHETVRTLYLFIRLKDNSSELNFSEEFCFSTNQPINQSTKGFKKLLIY